MKSSPGTYAVILENHSRAVVEVGRWGQLAIEPGYYVYVGSAFGPGGVAARVLRHCRISRRKHWHIDYLRECVEPVGAWCSYDRERIEHRWAQALADMGWMSPVPGFGCSDCGCLSHLFYTTRLPDQDCFERAVGAKVELWIYRLPD